MERRWETRDSKIGVIREVESGKTLAQVSRKTYKENARIAELERLVGQLYAENEFFKKALARLEGKIKEEEVK